MAGKRIGFVDYNLDNYHANVFLKNLREKLSHRGFVIVGGTALQPAPSKAWAKHNGLQYFDTVDQLDAAVDCFMVLAPSNPEVHLQLCEEVFPCGKPTYVDKTFAPDLATAKQIFALADTHGVAAQTSSVLRYTNIQDTVRADGSPVQHVVAWGSGASLAEYAIHPLEITVSCMGSKVTRLMRRGTGQFTQLLLDFENGRTAVVNVYLNHSTAYAATVTTQAATHHVTVESAAMWHQALDAILDFLDAGQANIDRAETLALMAARDAALSDAPDGVWMDLPTADCEA
jgi:predicted dehydrogenase